MRTRAGAVVLGLLATGAGSAMAAPSLPDARPPDASTLRDLGVRVSWPVGTRIRALAPGDRVVVRVKALRGDPAARHTVHLALVRVDRRGNGLRSVARRSMRDGTFAVRLPRVKGARYALRLAVAGRRFVGWIEASKPPEDVVPPAPDGAPGSSAPPPDRAPARPGDPNGSVSSPPLVPGPGSEPPSCPAQGTTSASMSLTSGSGPRGAKFEILLKNTGTGCLTGGVDYGWERRRPDGSWQPAGEPRSWIALAFIAGPGTTHRFPAEVWPELEPGPHRVVKSFSGPRGDAVTLRAPLDVLP